MKAIGAAALLLVSAAGDSALDMSAARRLVILHDGRTKPLDSFAREMLREVTGKERLPSYRDSETNEKVVVFGDAEPVEALLRLVSEPQRFREMRFIRVDHPGLKKKYKLDEHRIYFSLRDFDACREELEKDGQRIDREEATSAERAVLMLVRKQSFVEAIFQERILSIVPVPFGQTGGWMTPGDVQLYFSSTPPTDPRFRAIKAALDRFLKDEKTAASRDAALRASLGAYERMKAAVARNDAAEFKASTEALESALRSVNPEEVSTPEEIDRELWYNELKPFSWSAGLFALAMLLFIGAYAFKTNSLWIGALALQSAAIGITAYGYGLRWLISGRYPLSNHYESMIMVAFAAGLLTLIAELLTRRRIAGLAGTTAACIMILLAETVPTFAEQAAIKNLVPALQTFWMTIHVPVIMTGYAGGLILCVLGHIYVFMHLFGRLSPEKGGELDDTMYRILQVTVLFLLAGILLGAVWAGEAWGRPWGWDMKETWALITLVAYIATLHGRFTGKVRGLGTALCGITAFMLVILCYYGVNFLFGRGLHTYGFGSGEVWPVVVFFVCEAALMIAAALVEIARRRAPPDESAPE
ncbi:MAG TPA: cytochrome c biogenesis protein CcsA [Planctomycetota bacterium]|nr:cytochrome c biogenesis protein CcsA [Planctomycetota bacterium]